MVTRPFHCTKRHRSASRTWGTYQNSNYHKLRYDSTAVSVSISQCRFSTVTFCSCTSGCRNTLELGKMCSLRWLLECDPVTVVWQFGEREGEYQTITTATTILRHPMRWVYVTLGSIFTFCSRICCCRNTSEQGGGRMEYRVGVFIVLNIGVRPLCASSAKDRATCKRELTKPTTIHKGRCVTNIFWQNIPDKIYRTKYTGQNVPGQNIPDNIYREVYTGQNIQDKIYRTKHTDSKQAWTKYTGQYIPDKIYLENINQTK